MLMSFDFLFVRLFRVRYFCYYPYMGIHVTKMRENTLREYNLNIAISLLRNCAVFRINQAYLNILPIMFITFGVLVPKHVYITWLSNILILSVPQEDYSRSSSCSLHSISYVFIMMIVNCSKKLSST